MKTKIALILFLATTLPFFAQKNNIPESNGNWTIGLNFSAHTFNSENNFNNLLFTLERKINDQFFISLGTGLGSYKLNNSNGLTSLEVSQTGNTITKMISTEFEPSTRIPLHLSLKYQPFDWNIAPYLSFGYGMEYYFGSNTTYMTRTSAKSQEGYLLSEDAIKTTEKNSGGLRGRAHLSIGVSYKLNSTLHFDANILYTGFDPAYLSIGIKYGF